MGKALGGLAVSWILKGGRQATKSFLELFLALAMCSKWLQEKLGPKRRQMSNEKGMKRR